MGNENEIDGIAPEIEGIDSEAGGIDSGERSPFLPEEIHDLDGTGEIYSLEEEFAKAKKNKPYKLYLFVTLFIVVVVGAVFLFTWLKERDYHNVTIDIEEFEDIRLRNIIDSVRSRGSNIDLMKIGLQILEVDMLSKMLEVRTRAYDREIAVLSRSLSDAETNRLIKGIRNDEERYLRKIKARYQYRISEKKRQISRLEWERHKEQKEIQKGGADVRVSNTDKLYALKMKKLKEKQQSGTEALRRYFDSYVAYLTLKYNPRFKNQKVNSIISATESGTTSRTMTIQDHDQYLEQAGFTGNDLQTLKKRIEDYSMLLKRLERIPYRNSIPGTLAAMERLSGSIVSDYEKLRQRMAETLRQRNKTIEMLRRYEIAFEYALRAEREHGLVIDPHDQGRILVYMNKNLGVKPGETASVYHGERFVGKITFFKDIDGILKARVTSLASKKRKVMPVNRIILDRKKK